MPTGGDRSVVSYGLIPLFPDGGLLIRVIDPIIQTPSYILSHWWLAKTAINKI